MAHFAPILALGTGALLLPQLNSMMFNAKDLPDGKKGDESDRHHNEMMEQYAAGGMMVQEHQWNSGWHKFDVENPPISTFVAHVDPFENERAIRERYEETANFWDHRIKNNMLQDLRQGRATGYLPRKKMPFVHAATREIRHPTTGATTGFINNAFMPEHANIAQRERAQKVLALSGLEDAHEAAATGTGVFRHNHGQSFRFREYG